MTKRPLCQEIRLRHKDDLVGELRNEKQLKSKNHIKEFIFVNKGIVIETTVVVLLYIYNIKYL